MKIRKDSVWVRQRAAVDLIKVLSTESITHKYLPYAPQKGQPLKNHQKHMGKN